MVKQVNFQRSVDDIGTFDPRTEKRKGCSVNLKIL